MNQEVTEPVGWWDHVPPTLVHLSLRAYEWLTYADAFHGCSFIHTREPGHLVCPRPTLEHKAKGRGSCCGVEDARALYLGHPARIVYRDFNDPSLVKNKFKLERLVLPTCGTCAVVLDRCLERPLFKRGSYVIPYLTQGKKGVLFKWVHARGKQTTVNVDPSVWATAMRIHDLTSAPPKVQRQLALLESSPSNHINDKVSK